MLDRALSKARRGTDEKVNINFQLPSNLKDEFENLCKSNGVSVTSMLNSLIEVAIEEHKGINIDDQSTLRLLEIQSKFMKDLEWYRENQGNLPDFEYDNMSIIENSLHAIYRELQKKGMSNESNN